MLPDFGMGLWQDAIAGTLLTAVRMEAGLSLEPILVLVAALARDLQADFLAFMPRLAGALTELVENGKNLCATHFCLFLGWPLWPRSSSRLL